MGAGVGGWELFGGHAIEEVYGAGLEGILGSDDAEALIADEGFENL